MKWIKASERLPDIVEFHLIYRDHEKTPSTMYVTWDTKLSEFDLKYELFEWLDESEEQAGEYWKQRCEAAENLSKLYGDWQDLLNPDADEMSKDALEAFKKWGAALKIWQKLKNTTP